MRVGRRGFLRVLALGAVAAPAAARAAVGRGPELLGLRVGSARPFAGDRRLFATLSPRRGSARVSFRLTRAARVRMEAVRTDTVRAGRRVRDLPLGESGWIGAIVRDGAPRTPRGADVLEEGDEVVLLADPERIAAMRRLFERS